MEQLNEQTEGYKAIEPVEQNETEEQKKRRVPRYYLSSDIPDISIGSTFMKFDTKKELKEFLESHDYERLNPIVILGHEVPIQFNKVVKVDF
jgi:hypothetical protein